MRIMQAIGLAIFLCFLDGARALTAQEQADNQPEKVHADIIVEQSKGHLLASYQLSKPVTTFQFQYSSNPIAGALLQVQDANLLIAHGTVRSINGKPFQTFSVSVKADLEGDKMLEWSVSQPKPESILLNPRTIIGEESQFQNTLCIKDQDNSCTNMDKEPEYYNATKGGIIDAFSANEGYPILIGKSDFDVEEDNYRIMFAPSLSPWIRDFVSNAVRQGLSDLATTGIWEPEDPIDVFAHHFNKPEEQYYWTVIAQSRESFILNFRADDIEKEYEIIKNEMSENILFQLARSAAYEWFSNFPIQDEKWIYSGAAYYWTSISLEKLLKTDEPITPDFKISGKTCINGLKAVIEEKAEFEWGTDCAVFSMYLADKLMEKQGSRIRILDAWQDAKSNFSYDVSPKKLMMDFLEQENVPEDITNLFKEPSKNPEAFSALLYAKLKELNLSVEDIITYKR